MNKAELKRLIKREAHLNGWFEYWWECTETDGDSSEQFYDKLVTLIENVTR